MTRGSYDKSMSERYLPSTDDAVPDDPPKGKETAKDVKKISGIAGYYAMGVYGAAKMTQSDVYFKAIKFGRTYNFIPSTYSSEFKQVSKFARGTEWVSKKIFWVSTGIYAIDAYNACMEQNSSAFFKDILGIGAGALMTYGGYMGIFIGGSYLFFDTFVDLSPPDMVNYDPPLIHQRDKTYVYFDLKYSIGNE